MKNRVAIKNKSTLETYSLNLSRSRAPVEFEISVVKVGNSLRMTIPKPIAKAMNLSKGDTLLVSMTNGDMVVRKQA